MKAYTVVKICRFKAFTQQASAGITSALQQEFCQDCDK